MELHHRAAAITATVAKYLDAPFAWGKSDCVRMAAFHVRQMGHKVSLAKAGAYGSEIGAVRALKRAGFDTIEAALDARFDRIAPASALPGDIIALPGAGPLSALAIRLNNNRILNTFEGRFIISEPRLFVAAWRVPCLRIADAGGVG